MRQAFKVRGWKVGSEPWRERDPPIRQQLSNPAHSCQPNYVILLFIIFAEELFIAITSRSLYDRVLSCKVGVVARVREGRFSPATDKPLLLLPLPGHLHHPLHDTLIFQLPSYRDNSKCIHRLRIWRLNLLRHNRHDRLWSQPPNQLGQHDNSGIQLKNQSENQGVNTKM